MSNLMRIFWLIALLIFVSGCSGFKVACQIGSDVPGEVDQDICDLKTGEKIRLNLVDGTRVDGVIQSFSCREIILAAEAKNLEARSYSTAEIFSIEEENSYTAFKITALAMVLTGVVVGGAAYLSNADLGWDTDVQLVSFWAKN